MKTAKLTAADIVVDILKAALCRLRGVETAMTEDGDEYPAAYYDAVSQAIKHVRVAIDYAEAGPVK